MFLYGAASVVFLVILFFIVAGARNSNERWARATAGLGLDKDQVLAARNLALGVNTRSMDERRIRMVYRIVCMYVASKPREYWAAQVLNGPMPRYDAELEECVAYIDGTLRAHNDAIRAQG